jgi:hypothetical protein
MAAKMRTEKGARPSRRNAAYPTHGPTTAIEKTLAPRVVRPPWASRRAWKSRTIVPRAAITGGRKITAPSPVPVGWDDEPVTEGNLIAERTKVKAPAAPSNNVASGCSLMVRLIARVPWMTKGAATAVHAAA